MRSFMASCILGLATYVFKTWGVVKRGQVRPPYFGTTKRSAYITTAQSRFASVVHHNTFYLLGFLTFYYLRPPWFRICMYAYLCPRINLKHGVWAEGWKRPRFFQAENHVTAGALRPQDFGHFCAANFHLTLKKFDWKIATFLLIPLANM